MEYYFLYEGEEYLMNRPTFRIGYSNSQRYDIVLSGGRTGDVADIVLERTGFLILHPFSYHRVHINGRTFDVTRHCYTHLNDCDVIMFNNEHCLTFETRYTGFDDYSSGEDLRAQERFFQDFLEANPLPEDLNAPSTSTHRFPSENLNAPSTTAHRSAREDLNAPSTSIHRSTRGALSAPPTSLYWFPSERWIFPMDSNATPLPTRAPIWAIPIPDFNSDPSDTDLSPSFIDLTGPGFGTSDPESSFSIPESPIYDPPSPEYATLALSLRSGLISPSYSPPPLPPSRVGTPGSLDMVYDNLSPVSPNWDSSNSTTSNPYI